MKVAFIFDTNLFKDDDLNYWGMTLNYDFFHDRYLAMFDSIVVTTRVRKMKDKVENTDGYRIVNGSNVEVCPIEEYKEIPDMFFKKRAIKEKLEKIIKNVDKVIIRMPSVLGILAVEVCNKENKDYIIEMVACPWDGYMNHTNPIGKLVAPIMYFKTKKCVKYAPKVLYVTENFLQQRYPTNGKACACSDVMLESVDDAVIEKRKRRVENLNLNSINICTVANVGMKYKGHVYMLKALSKLKSEGKEHMYYLIGNGNQVRLKKYIKKWKLENNVIFCGSLAHQEVFKKLSEMDLYVQPSLQEGLPRALIEAMSIGMPAIGSNVGGIPELLDDSMIFRRKKWIDIYKSIKNLDKKTLNDHIEYSYAKSKRFLPQELEKRRIEFYTER